MMLFRLKLPQILSCKELKYDNRWTCQIRISIWRNETGIAQTVFTFFPREVQFALILQFFFARDMSNYILAGNFEENFVENVVSGNSVQIGPNFPAKSLSIYIRKIFLTTFLTNVVNLWLKRIWDKTLCLIVYWILQNNKRWHKN